MQIRICSVNSPCLAANGDQEVIDVDFGNVQEWPLSTAAAFAARWVDERDCDHRFFVRLARQHTGKRETRVVALSAGDDNLMATRLCSVVEREPLWHQGFHLLFRKRQHGKG